MSKTKDVSLKKLIWVILREKAAGTENLMPYLIEAVSAYATMGEIADVFRDVFGEFDEPVKF